VNIFIYQDAAETGPFTWVDVFILLRKGDLSTDTPARIEGSNEIRSLEEWGLWREGDEVGPFTWDEISAMLEAGVLDLENKARFEGDPELSNLKGVIRKSQEICLPAENRKLGALWELGELGGLWIRNIRDALRAPRTRFHVAGGLAVILVCALALFSWGRNTQPKIEPPAEKRTAITEQNSGVQEPVPPQISETKPEPVSTQPAMAVASSENQPPLAAEPSIPKTDSENPPPLEKTAQEIPAPSKPDVASVPSPQPSGPTQPAAPTIPVATSVQPNAPQVAQANLPTPKPVATPAPVVTSVTDFFKILSVKLLNKEPKDGIGVWKLPEIGKKDSKTVFLPCLEVKLATAENARSEKMTMKAYFYDRNNKLLATASKPSKSGKKALRTLFEMPVLFYKEKPDRIFFEIPVDVAKTEWKAVVVVGDKQEAKSACYPSDVDDYRLDYAEKQLVHDRSAKRVARKPAIDPLIEYVVKTKNPKVPQITLFLRPPKGVDNGEEIKGVLALCLLANGLEPIRQELQKEEMSGDYNGLLAFANKHKLAVLAWGSSSALWANANYDDISSAQGRELKASFNIVANAWERGVLELGEKYGLPTKNFLMWGQCGSAHLAHALCLAKPNYFLAIDVHIPGFFEKPTPEASKILWCVTTGELYYSYDYSLRFVADCKKLGYPIVYKAIVGLGHAGHPDATAMGLTFFEFALTQKDLRDEYEKKMASSIDRAKMAKSDEPTPWPEAFQNPPYFGDIINQETYPASQKEMIPEKFRIPIPTKEIREIWARQN